MDQAIVPSELFIETAKVLELIDIANLGCCKQLREKLRDQMSIIIGNTLYDMQNLPINNEMMKYVKKVTNPYEKGTKLKHFRMTYPNIGIQKIDHHKLKKRGTTLQRKFNFDMENI